MCHSGSLMSWYVSCSFAAINLYRPPVELTTEHHEYTNSPIESRVIAISVESFWLHGSRLQLYRRLFVARNHAWEQMLTLCNVSFFRGRLQLQSSVLVGWRLHCLQLENSFECITWYMPLKFFRNLCLKPDCGFSLIEGKLSELSYGPLFSSFTMSRKLVVNDWLLAHLSSDAAFPSWPNPQTKVMETEEMSTSRARSFVGTALLSKYDVS